MLRLHFPELKTLQIELWTWPESPENLTKTIKKVIENCPKLKNILLFGAASYIDDHFILAMFQDFNVHISIDARPFRSIIGTRESIEERQKSLEKYMKNHDLQLYEKYMKMDKGSQWARKLSSYY